MIKKNYSIISKWNDYLIKKIHQTLHLRSNDNEFVAIVILDHFLKFMLTIIYYRLDFGKSFYVGVLSSSEFFPFGVLSSILTKFRHSHICHLQVDSSIGVLLFALEIRAATLTGLFGICHQ